MSDLIPIKFFNANQDYIIVTDKNNNRVVDKDDLATVSKSFGEFSRGDTILFQEIKYTDLRKSILTKLLEESKQPFIKETCSAPANNKNKQAECITSLTKKVSKVQDLNKALSNQAKAAERGKEFTKFECSAISFISKGKTVEFNFLCQPKQYLIINLYREKKPDPGETDSDE